MKIPEKDEKFVPPGTCCYEFLQAKDEAGAHWVLSCPYREIKHDQQEQMNGYCHFLESGDWEGDGCGLGERRWTGEEFAFIEHDDAFAIINPYVTAFFGFNLRGGQEHMTQYLSENHFPDKMHYENKFR